MDTYNNVSIKWNGNLYQIDNVSSSSTLQDLKLMITKKTNVLPHRQKLLNVKFKGKAPADDLLLKESNIKSNMKIMMMGTTEENLKEVLADPPDVGEVVDDFDIEEGVEVKLENREEHLAKIDKRIQSYEVKKFNEPRPGKKLLVLDVDYTLFDHRSTAEKAVELMRPYLHEFLTAAYQHYDIVIWSATSMKWIEVKMKELGVASNPSYRIAFYMDHGAMITVHSSTYGLVDTKPLKVIWGKYPEFYSPDNTIMFDDLRRNFLMNPQSGLKIKPFKEAHSNRSTDCELLLLTEYLQEIAEHDKFSQLDHRRWQSYKKKKPRRQMERD